MNDDAKLVAIVAAHSSGELYAKSFAERGWKCVHVQSVPEIPSQFRAGFRPDDFVANVIFDGDLDRLVAALERWPIRAAIPGTDEGVRLSDALGERLRLPGNGVALGDARCDKGRMIEVVAAAGLQTARQLRSADVDVIRAWVQGGPGFPVVVKPSESGGSDRVALCESDPELVRALRAILDAPSVPGVPHVGVVVQERLRGTEYVVDTMSWNGRRRVTDIWRYDKRPANGAAFIYHAAELLPFDGPEQRALGDYTGRVLDALGHRFGPAHTEVMLTAQGPVLVETASRPHGGHAPAICQACVGVDQIDLMVDACIDPSAFERSADAGYRIERHCTIVFLVSRRAGRLRGLPGLQEIRSLRSFHDASLRVGPGDILRRTTDLFTSPGVVVLMHPDKSVVEADQHRVRELESDGLLELEPDGSAS